MEARTALGSPTHHTRLRRRTSSYAPPDALVKPRIRLAAIITLTSVPVLVGCGSGTANRAGTHAGTTSTTASSSLPASPVSAAGAQPCGKAADETLARTVGLVAARIYNKELASAEVFADKRQVEGFGPLLSALESGDREAIDRAVMSLVYSHTHVVRLRVTRGSSALADVGGPHIIAPVGGTLRRNGKTLGHYVLSVQDDLGYVKLVSRFIGVPLVLSQRARALPIEGAVSPAPPHLPTHGRVRYRGATFQAFSFPAEAFPAGTLRVSLLVPVSGSLARQSCAAIRTAELARVAQHISRRFSLSPKNFGSYISTTAPLTGGLIYIRTGSRQLAASSQPAPAPLPAQGTVRYRGSSYAVSSFTAPSTIGPVRIYQLVR